MSKQKFENDECAAFQAQLPELLSEGKDLTGDPHLKSCPNCAELVRDLYTIAQQAKLLLPLHDPSPAVWDRIEENLHNGGRQDGAQ